MKPDTEFNRLLCPCCCLITRCECGKIDYFWKNKYICECMLAPGNCNTIDSILSFYSITDFAKIQEPDDLRDHPDYKIEYLIYNLQKLFICCCFPYLFIMGILTDIYTIIIHIIAVSCCCYCFQIKTTPCIYRQNKCCVPVLSKEHFYKMKI